MDTKGILSSAFVAVMVLSAFTVIAVDDSDAAIVDDEVTAYVTVTTTERIGEDAVKQLALRNLYSDPHFYFEYDEMRAAELVYFADFMRFSTVDDGLNYVMGHRISVKDIEAVCTIGPNDGFDRYAYIAGEFENGMEDDVCEYLNKDAWKAGGTLTVTGSIDHRYVCDDRSGYAYASEDMIVQAYEKIVEKSSAFYDLEYRFVSNNDAKDELTIRFVYSVCTDLLTDRGFIYLEYESDVSKDISEVTYEDDCKVQVNASCKIDKNHAYVIMDGKRTEDSAVIETEYSYEDIGAIIDKKYDIESEIPWIEEKKNTDAASYIEDYGWDYGFEQEDEIQISLLENDYMKCLEMTDIPETMDNGSNTMLYVAIAAIVTIVAIGATFIVKRRSA